ncbi:MAG: nucleotidyltransferase domain-containing protein [Actinomycetota bacterium]
MNGIKPLNDLMGNATRIDILRTFFQYPGEFTGRHIAKLCHLPQATVQKQLDVLIAHHILTFKQVGPSRVFSLNAEHILYSALMDLFDREQKMLMGIEARIRKTIDENRQLRNKVVHASTFGSIATGHNTQESDLDLFLVIRDNYQSEDLSDWMVNTSSQIITASGINIHPFIVQEKELPKLRKSLRDSIKQQSRRIYGISTEELEQKWQKPVKSDRRK